MYGLSCLIPFFQQPDISRTSPVLLVTITMCNHPVECDTLYHIFTQYGSTVLRIIIFEKSGMRMLASVCLLPAQPMRRVVELVLRVLIGSANCASDNATFRKVKGRAHKRIGVQVVNHG